MAPKPKKASTSYSPAPMGRAEKAFTKYAAREKQVGKYGMTKQKDGRLTINVGKKPSTASKVAGVAGKVAGKAAGMAKSKVKADIKAAKTVAKFTAKAAMAPSELLIKGAKAGAKALAKEPRLKRQVGKAKPIKQFMNNKNIKKK